MASKYDLEFRGLGDDDFVVPFRYSVDPFGSGFPFFYHNVYEGDDDDKLKIEIKEDKDKLDELMGEIVF